MSRKRKARATATEIYRRVNGQRQKRGREPVAGSTRLAAAAEDYARELAHSDTIGHRVDGTTPAERCGDFDGVSENVVRVSSRGRPDRVARRAVEWWVASNDHADNLLRWDLAHDGVGVWLYHGDAYAVQDFATDKQTSGSGGVLGWLTP